MSGPRSPRARWLDSNELFHQLAKLPVERREHELSRRCSDPIVRAEVSSLLDASDRCEGFLDRAVLEPELWPGGVPRIGDRGWLEAQPKEIGSYEVIREIGRGGSGIVYEAIDRILGRSVAVKVINADLVQDPHRLAEEGLALSKVRHRNVARFESLETLGNQSVLTVEYVDGPALSERLAEGRLESVEALSILRQVLAGLGAVHRAELLHCDLKPSNIKLSKIGLVRLLDFGLARCLGDGATSLAGTPGYASAEQLAGAPIDQRSDLFSFGVVAYECLTGHRPTEEHDPESGTKPPGWPAELSQSLRRCIVSCLATNAERRPASVDPIRTQIEEEISRLALSSSATPSTTAEPVVSSSRLPERESYLVGREELVAEILERLERDPVLVLIGPEGIGKSSVAIEVARTLQSRGCPSHYVDLSLTANEAKFDATLYGIPKQCDSQLRIVLLDGADFLPTRAIECAVGLAANGTTRVLITCRELDDDPSGTRLASLLVPGLAICGRPPSHEGTSSTDESTSSEAGTLLLRRLTNASGEVSVHDRRAAEVIVRAVGGNPDAIERIAHRSDGSTLSELAVTIVERTSSDQPHSTLAALTNALLADLPVARRNLLARLSIFSGGWTLEAAISVCGEEEDDAPQVRDHLDTLVECGLVGTRSEGDAPARHWLGDSVRKAARALVSEAAFNRLRDRHLDYYAEFVHETNLLHGQRRETEWLKRLMEEYDNIHGALIGHYGDCDLQGPKRLGLAADLAQYFISRTASKDERAILLRVLQLPSNQEPTRNRSRTASILGVLLAAVGEIDEARRWLQEGVRVADVIGEERLRCGTRINLAHLQADTGRIQEARTLLNLALEIATEIGERDFAASALLNLARACHRQWDLDAADEFLQRALAHNDVGGGNHKLPNIYANLGAVALKRGHLEESRLWSEKSLAIARSLGNVRGVSGALSNLGLVALSERDFAAGRSFFASAAKMDRDQRNEGSLCTALNNLGILERLAKNYQVSRELHLEALALCDRTSFVLKRAFVLSGLASLAADVGDVEEARRWLGESVRYARIIGGEGSLAGVVAIGCAIRIRVGDWEAAVQLASCSVSTYGKLGMPVPDEEVDAIQLARTRGREELGASRFDRGWKLGSTWSVDRAIQSLDLESPPATGDDPIPTPR